MIVAGRGDCDQMQRLGCFGRWSLLCSPETFPESIQQLCRCSLAHLDHSRTCCTVGKLRRATMWCLGCLLQVAVLSVARGWALGAGSWCEFQEFPLLEAFDDRCLPSMCYLK
ncbi:hypothetical protein BKA67DRAFT_207575 [Truncatella angustata]|uniref:Uncharacterized protein n=1 Tax=Truncatella angustata TaxID=152316 RepID=A0A9P8UTP0_9PEZI|nr:uncharacterized protein BKA67DRAFT_207575 [Truncatella angustata]KAH6658169.1 hypothetical protein BKA67DRAFT_207575 [Truncatella angustata]